MCRLEVKYRIGYPSHIGVIRSSDFYEEKLCITLTYILVTALLESISDLKLSMT